MYLSVIIPAYNEEKRLPKTLKEIDKYLSRQSYDYEIIVVNDGSKDKTAKVIGELFSVVKNLRLIDNKENHGKGYAVRQGMLEATGDYRLFTDADNSTSIDQVEKMLAELERGRGVVIGSRDIIGAIIAVPQVWWRRKLGDIFNLIVQVVSGLWGIWDTQCGFKGFSKVAVEEIFPKLTINRWAFDVEILVLAKKLGYKIKEVPVAWINSPESKVKLKGMIKMLFEVFQVKWNLICKKYG
ncbi:glycosyltransferase family 2 protein [Patescibacteria group bacterium]|nr:glycosyltransferase family 2 protein [Patescibacteria group bacterium]